MKQKLFILFFASFISIVGHAQQWEALGSDDFNAPASNQGYYLTLTEGLNNKIFSAYSDESNGSKISVKQYVNNKWEYLGNPGFSEGRATYIDITIDSSGVPYVIFTDDGNGSKSTVMRFINNAWEVLGVKGFTPNRAYHNSIAIAQDGTPYVIFFDTASSDKASVYSFTNDTWSIVGSAGISSNRISASEIKINSNGVPHVAYLESGLNNQQFGSVQRFVNGIWEHVGSAGFTGSTYQSLSLEIDSNDIPYLGFRDDSNGSVPAVYKFVNNTWEAVGSNAISSSSNYIAMTLNADNNPVIGYSDNNNGGRLTVKELTNDTWQTIGVEGFSTNSPGGTPSIVTTTNGKIYAGHPGDYFGSSSAAIFEYHNNQWNSTGSNTGIAKGNLQKDALAIGTDMLPYLVYPDQNNGSKITVMRYNNDTWETVGTPGFSASSASNATIDIDSNNIPYVFYSDNSVTGRATVQRYLNGSWEIVGSTGFSSGRVQRPTLVLDPNNIPYIAFDNYTGSNNLVVYRFVNDTWEQVGSNNFTGPTADTDLAFSADGTPYLAYQDGSNGYKEAVQRFVNGNWERIGVASKSAGYAYGINIELTTEDIPYIAYSDSGNGTKGSVQRFVNNAWEFVGTNGFTASSAIYTMLALSPEGIPYIAYKDGANNSKLTVQKFEESNWESAGQVGFSAASIDWPSIKVASDGTVYTAYYSNNGAIFAKKYSDNALPVFTNPAIIEIQENLIAIGDINTVDADGDTEGNGITYLLSNNADGGIDNSFVEIESNTGALSFKTAPNFEVAQDNDSNNIYEIQINATDSKGGSSIQNLTVGITNLNELQLTVSEQTNVLCFGGDTGSINLSVIEGNADYTLTLELDGNTIGTSNGSDTNPLISNLSAGFYTVTVTDAQNDTATVTATISEPSTALQVTEEVTMISTANANDGNISLVINGGVAPYIYSWSNNETTKDISGLGEGIYTVTVTDSNSCSVEVQATIVTNTAPNFTSQSSIIIVENQTTAVNLASTDLEGETEGNGITYNFTTQNGNGSDNELFHLNTESGLVEFNAVPDYESPTDSNSDNSYEIQVSVSDSFGATSSLNVVITVANLDNDFDEDGIEDAVDTDDDNDGTPDTEDQFPLDNSESTDFDNDGTGDNADTDDDNDGTPDTEDDFPNDASENTDSDGDGIGNNEDSDDDNDGILDEEDEFPLDGTDTDGDGIPDALDDDDDNDGTPDSEDLFPLDNTESTDFDNDGLGDNTDTDDDNDGTPDTEDAFPNDATETSDADGDGMGDNEDSDDDNDGISDENDEFPLNDEPTVIAADAFTPNGDGINDAWVIPGIDNYPNNIVKVYNRSGRVVFEAVSYANDWQGFYESNREQLPAGSYLYTISLGNGQAPLQGWIYINY